MDRKRPHHFRELGEVRRGGIRSPAAPRGSGQETGDSGEAFRRTEVAGRPACDIHRTAPAQDTRLALASLRRSRRGRGPRLGPGQRNTNFYRMAPLVVEQERGRPAGLTGIKSRAGGRLLLRRFDPESGGRVPWPVCSCTSSSPRALSELVLVLGLRR